MIDALDLIARTVLLDVLGLSPAQALDVLDYLWTDRPGPGSEHRW